MCVHVCACVCMCVHVCACACVGKEYPFPPLLPSVTVIRHKCLCVLLHISITRCSSCMHVTVVVAVAAVTFAVGCCCCCCCCAQIMKELLTTYTNYGIDLDKRHLTILADTMTSRGGVLGITRFGACNQHHPACYTRCCSIPPAFRAAVVWACLLVNYLSTVKAFVCSCVGMSKASPTPCARPM
jgi:hypothetical protein